MPVILRGHVPFVYICACRAIDPGIGFLLSLGRSAAGTLQSEPLTLQQETPWDDALPEPLRAALRNTPADFLRYILPGLVGRSAAAKVASTVEAAFQDGPVLAAASSGDASAANRSTSAGSALGLSPNRIDETCIWATHLAWGR